MAEEAFASLDGAIDFGKDYEYLMAAYYGLIFSFNEDIADFYLSTNNNDMGDFDDVIVELEFRNGEEHIFALQLKHVFRSIAQITLVADPPATKSKGGKSQAETTKKENKKFSLKKYGKEFTRIKNSYKEKSYTAPFENFHFILLAISSLEKFGEFDENWKRLEPVANGVKMETDIFIQKATDCFEKELFSVSATDDDLIYRFKSEKEDSEDEDFFKQFSLYTKQKTAKEMETCIAEIIMKTFKNCDSKVAVNYLNFFSYWCRRDYGTFKLSKHDVRMKLAELVLTPYIPEPNMEELNRYTKERVEPTMEIFSLFDVVLIKNQDKEIIDRIWNMLLVWCDLLRYGTEWSAPLPGVYISAFGKLKNFPVSAFSETFNELSLKKMYLVLWHVGALPLVVKIDETSIIHQQDVLLAIELCEHKGKKKKFFLIDENNNFKEKSHWKIFKTLSDLHSCFAHICQQFQENLLISIQGRPRVPLSYLIQGDERLMDAVTPIDIVMMQDNNYIIGNDCKKKFPKHYITRMIPKVLIDIKVLSECKDDLFVLSSLGKIDTELIKRNAIELQKFLLLRQHGYVPKKNLNPYVGDTKDEEHLKGNFFIVAEEGCTKQQFEEICAINPDKNCHHVFFVDKEKIEWIESRGEIKNLQKWLIDIKDFTTENYVRDEDLLRYFTRSLNIICADPGMGKSILLKYLQITCPSYCWVITVGLNEQVKFFEEEHDVEEILEHFIRSESNNLLVEKILSVLVSKKNILFLWDGFDEVPERCIGSVLKTINILSNHGFKQWLTGRTISKKTLERTFNTFVLTLTQLNSQDQYDYVYNYLEEKYEDEERIKEIVDKMNTNISTSLNCGYFDYTGIPLQIHMLVEIYLRKPEEETNVSVVTLVDIYKEFIEGKFETIFEKADADTSNYYMQEIYEQYKSTQLDLYENAAIKSTFDKEDLISIPLNCDELLEDLEENEDALGLISGVNVEKNFIFVHKTYQEFLAASWIAKHYEAYPNIVTPLLEEKYSNIRFMFDMLLAKDSPVHLAVLYRNLDMLKSYEDEIENCKDAGGRNALHLACSWGRRHPVIKVMEKNEEIEILNRSDENRKFMLDYMDYLKDDGVKCLGLIDLQSSTTLEAVDKFFNDLGQQVDETADRYEENVLKINSNDITRVDIEDKEHLEILKVLLDRKCGVLEEDTIFKWTPIQYADNCLCLALLDLIMKYRKIDFRSLENYGHIPTLLHYSVTFLYDNLLTIFDEVPYIIYLYSCGKVTLLQQACNASNIKCVVKLLQHDYYQNVINTKCAFSGNPLSSAVLRGNLELIDVLLEKGAKVNGHTQPPLTLATYRGDINCCKKLLAAGANVNDVARDGTSSLLAASMLNDYDIIKLLLENGADVNYANNGYTALSYTVHSDVLKTVQLILQYKPDINFKCNELGYTPLHIVSEYNNIPVLKCLLEQGADATIKSKSLHTPLHVALINSKREIALELIRAEPSVINEYDWDENGASFTPVMHATKGNYPEIIQELAKYGADLDCSQSIYSPLCYAVSKNFESCVIALIEGGASVNKSTDNGIYPLHESTKHLSIMKILLGKAADINIRNNQGATALHFAVEYKKLDVVEELIKEGAEINVRTEKNITPLHSAILVKDLAITKFLLEQGAEIGDDAILLCEAIQSGFLESISLLIEKGADVNARNKIGLAPLSSAIMFNNNCVKILLEYGANNNTIIIDGPFLPGFPSINVLHLSACLGDIFTMVLLTSSGADVNIADNFGETPLHYACGTVPLTEMLKIVRAVDNSNLNICLGYDREDCVKELLSRGANVNQKNNDGDTPLHVACVGKQTDVIKLLIEHGADVNELNNKKKSPLNLCFDLGNITGANLLVKHIAKLDIQDDFERKPLDYVMENINEKIIALQVAAFNGKADVLKTIIDTGVDVNMLNDIDYSALHIACRCGHFSSAKVLLDAGADVNQADSNGGNTPLHVSAHDSNMVELLIDKGATIDQTDPEGRSALFYACSSGSLDVVKLLHKRGANLNLEDSTKNTVLHISTQHILIIKYLVENDLNINQRNENNCTPLYNACLNNHYECAYYLINNGADVNTVTKEFHLTPLYTAVVRGHAEIVRLLLQSNADITVKCQFDRTSICMATDLKNLDIIKVFAEESEKRNDKDNFLGEWKQSFLLSASYGNIEMVTFLHKSGLVQINDSNEETGYTALHEACAQGNFDVAAYLIDNGADLDIKNKQQFSSLHLSTYNGHPSLVKLLLDKGADIEIKMDNEGSTPIFYTAAGASAAHEEILRILIDAGANVNVLDARGFTPLHFACKYGRLNCTRILLDSGADISELGHDGWTPLHYAATASDPGLINLLIDKGAAVNHTDNDGWTPLFRACSKGNLDLVKLLHQRGANLFVKSHENSSALNEAYRYPSLIKYLVENGLDVNHKGQKGRTALFSACVDNHYEGALCLLENGADVNAATEDLLLTPMHSAVINGHLDIVKLLLRFKPDISLKYKSGYTPICTAAAVNQLEVIKVFIEEVKNEIGADDLRRQWVESFLISAECGNIEILIFLHQNGLIKIDDRHETELSTALCKACTFGKYEIAAYLVENGADVNAQDNEGFTPLQLSSQHGHLNLIKLLVESKVEMDMCNNNGDAALLIAVNKEFPEIVKFLHENGANVNVVNNKGVTPLHCGVLRGHLEIIKFLLHCEADLGIKNQSGDTPIYLAAALNQFEVIKLFAEIDRNDLEQEWIKSFMYSAFFNNFEMLTLLHKSGIVEINAADERDGFTALHQACTSGNYDIAHYLIQHGADVNAKNLQGFVPLKMSSFSGHFNLVKLLFEHKAELDVPCNHGNTALFAAAAKGFLEIVEFLHENGATVNVIDADGDTPLHDAASYGHLSIVEYLVSKNINILHKNNNGKTALDLAIEKDNKAVIEFLEGLEQRRTS